MNITKEQADRVTVLAVRIAVWLPGESETGRALKNDAAEIADIMRGLAEDTELLALFAASQKQLPLNAAISATSPQAAQTEAQEREADGFSTPEVRELAEFAVDLYGVLPETCTKEEVNAFELGWKAGRAGRKP